MKAILLTEPGGTDKLTISDIDLPVLQDSEVLVKVKALSINPVDIKTRTGKGVYGRIKEQAPLILGWDISGEVVDVADSSSRFKPGDEVFGMVNFPGHGRAYAEYVAVPEHHLALKPQEISHEEAAAATLAALTAWQALVHQGQVQPGQRVFVHAAAGGVGHFAIQIAKHLGASVVGTASEPNTGFLKGLGVDQPIDYRSEDFEQAVREVDFVLDPIGGDTTRKSLNILRPGGKLISIVGGATEDVQALAQERRVSAANYLVQSNGEDMEQLAALLATGKIIAHVSHVFTMDEIAKAHEQIETGRTIGKVVVTVDGD
ncbi:NADP-dependent oxidoreductase [Telluribacter sp. SYSU D00476]|uniref:NADP-dependent oxidoreductase n=1 Tax=Telluribacter sp. SYSU D00476 TaxID=2811430 RepID=UPI001FF4869E|nr:NADP-dependent oxidoreductase [Telluribacter sp. SYSU D00476]